MTPVVPYAELFTLFGVTPAVQRRGRPQGPRRSEQGHRAGHRRTRPHRVRRSPHHPSHLGPADGVPGGLSAPVSPSPCRRASRPSRSWTCLPGPTTGPTRTCLPPCRARPNAMRPRTCSARCRWRWPPRARSATPTQKAVLFGGTFAEDRITQAAMQGRPAFPGSEELFVNSALWVSGRRPDDPGQPAGPPGPPPGRPGPRRRLDAAGPRVPPPGDSSWGWASPSITSAGDRHALHDNRHPGPAGPGDCGPHLHLPRPTGHRAEDPREGRRESAAS